MFSFVSEQFVRILIFLAWTHSVVNLFNLFKIVWDNECFLQPLSGVPSYVLSFYGLKVLAGLPGFARDSCSIIMSICAFHFYIIYFHFFYVDHGIPQTFDDILTS